MRNSVVVYGLSLAALVAAVSIRWLVDPLLGNDLPLVTVFGAVAFAAWLCGWRPAVLVVVLGYLASDYFFMAPRGQLTVFDAGRLAGFIAYLVTCGLIIYFGEATRAAQRSLAEREVELAEIVNSSDDAIISKSLDGIIQTWNVGAERIFGYTEAEAVGHSIRMLIPPELQDEEETILERLRRGEQIAHYETVRMAKDGRRLDISLTISPLRDAEGQIVGASKVARDVTERKRSEAAIEATELRFKTLTSYAPVGIFQSDVEGNCLFVNERWCELAGMSADEARGQGWVVAIHPEDRERVASEWYAEVGTRREFVSEYRFRKPHGEVTWLAGRAVALTDDAGHVTGYIGTVSDITEKKREQEQLQEADRLKDQFLATLAHELRNPLAPIRNGLQILKITEPSKEEAADIRAMMERQLDQMVRLVDDLLDISRITRNKLALRKERVELSSVIASAIETSRPLVEACGHKLSSRLPSEPIWLDADVTRLAQVLANLLNNAAKYTEAGGKIELAAKHDGAEVVIRVTDTGIGIPAEMLPKVFDMFTQVDDTLNRSQGGLGVGLTLVRQLVEMHGGSIEARSEGPGRGSEFVVRLPAVANAPKVETKTMDNSLNGGAGRRILVVDDNRDSAQTLGLLLKLMGHETHLAHDGLAALEAAERVRPELILLDIGLPKLTGHEVCRAIRQQPWGEEMVIIAVTGWGQEDDRRQSQEAGFNGHMVKPVAPDALKQLMVDVASGTIGEWSVAVG